MPSILMTLEKVLKRRRHGFPPSRRPVGLFLASIPAHLLRHGACWLSAEVVVDVWLAEQTWRSLDSPGFQKWQQQVGRIRLPSEH